LQLTIDPRRKAIVLESEEAAIIFSANHFIELAKEAIKLHGNFFVALSGGSTPKKIYQTIRARHKKDIDWTKVFLFWSDERACGPNDPESNYKMAMDSGFSELGIPQNQIFRMEGEGDIYQSAEDYERKVKTCLNDRHFDLIMLGIGEDGHTASLFPNTKALSETKKLVVANEVPQKNTFRMTFTYPLINSAHHTVFYALGKNKESILKEVIHSDILPASKVGTQKNPVWFILDRASGNFLI
jgi:6-phosphogluconolactonase